MPALQVRASSIDDAVLDPHASVPSIIAQHGQANSVYTAALLNKDAQLVDWGLHEERLARGILQLHAHSSLHYAAVASYLEAKWGLEGVHRLISGTARPVVRKALQLYMSQDSWSPALVFCMATDPDPETRAGATPVIIHVLVRPAPLQPEAAPVKVAVMGPCRRLPHVKHSSWVLERASLEQRKPPDAAEVLLTDETGAIMEGMTSNFAVVQGSAGSDSIYLRVAGPDQPALQGIAMRRVLQAAQQQGVPVEFKAPLLDKREQWREAFITNCVRGLQPISHIFLPPGEGPAPWDCHLPQPVPGPVTLKLLAGMTSLQETLPLDQLT